MKITTQSLARFLLVGVVIFIYILWTSLQLFFGMVQDNGALIHVNYLASGHWLLFLVLIVHMIYNEPQENWVTPYFGFIAISLVLMLGMCLFKPVYLRNVGFHHTTLVPSPNPLLANSVVCWLILIYLNFTYRNKKIISTKFFRIVSGLLLLAVAGFVLIWVLSQQQIYEFSRYSG